MKEIFCGDYSVYIGNEAFDLLEKYITQNNFSTLVLIADQQTYTYCFDYFRNRVPAAQNCVIYTFPAGEKSKTLATCTDIWNFLSEQKTDRDALVINLGGGVVTDLGGFVAATYQRGIKYINIPTSLLAKVDASVGGKTGVDFNGLKNQIGVIKNPEMVLIDSQFLKTLPQAELHSGIAEVLKHGLISASNYWSEVTAKKLGYDSDWDTIVYQSVVIKNAIVTQDSNEQNIRKHLNFGHTLGHAIESYCMLAQNRTPILHGHAVAIGMVLACYLSGKYFGFSEKVQSELLSVYYDYYPPTPFSAEEVQQILELMKYDKKNRKGVAQFVLLKDIGKPVLDCEVEESAIKEAFAYFNEIKKPEL